MNKEKIVSLSKYLTECKIRLTDKSTPAKHKNRDAQYREYLQREIKKTSDKLKPQV